MEAFLLQMAVNFSISKSIYPRPFYEKSCKMASVQYDDFKFLL
jgi:hypothetical protein